MKIEPLTVSERTIFTEALWGSTVAEGCEIEFTEPQKQELDRRLQSFELDQEGGDFWAAVKARILSR